MSVLSDRKTIVAARARLAGVAALAFCLLPVAPAAGQSLPTDAAASETLSTDADVASARAALDAWTQAYQAGDYDGQWRLTHPRIRRWRPRRLWRRVMIRTAREDGELLSYSIIRSAPATAEQLPCTEQGHCYRPGIRYVMFVIRSDYGNAAPPQPEYVAMAELDGAWYFGGGTFLNRPFGETSAIMTEADERRFRYRAN